MWSFLQAIRNEYRGWRRFKDATGLWPLWSILADLLSIPLLVAAGTYCFIVALGTRQLPLIYLALISAVICCATGWYGLRRLACKADVARGKRSTAGPSSPQTLEEFIR